MSEIAEKFFHDDETAELPSLSGDSNIPHLSSGWHRIGAEVANILGKITVYFKERQIFVASYRVRTLATDQNKMKLEKELR